MAIDPLPYIYIYIYIYITLQRLYLWIGRNWGSEEVLGVRLQETE
ncbi:hypothetical protein ACMBCM_05630 [Spiroplasma sp. K1]